MIPKKMRKKYPKNNKKILKKRNMLRTFLSAVTATVIK